MVTQRITLHKKKDDVFASDTTLIFDDLEMDTGNGYCSKP
jgi:hypothetical protein